LVSAKAEVFRFLGEDFEAATGFVMTALVAVIHDFLDAALFTISRGWQGQALP